MNISGEGDYVRSKIANGRRWIHHNYKTPSGLMEQHFDSPEECFVDEWILKWHVDDWNEYSKEEEEDELA